MQYLITFLEGILTFLSPCILPMLPVYVLYFMGEEKTNSMKKTLGNALAFVAGFTVIFVLLGIFAGTLGSFLLRYQKAVNVVTGAIVVAFGLHYIGVIRLGFLNRTIQFSKTGKPNSIGSTAVFGSVFAVSWSPCVGTFLGSALMLAANATGWVRGLQLLLCYSLGLGIPFILCAVLLDQLKGILNGIKRHYTLVNRICGAALILVGILMMSGLFSRLTQLLA